MVWAAKSDRGRVRERNEDAWAAEPKAGLFVVADGVGGHDDGHEASRRAVDMVLSAVMAPALAWPDEPRAVLDAEGAAVDRLRRAFDVANQHVHERGRQQGSNMATTLVGGLMNGRRLAVAHVGDSRAYRLRRRRLERLTRDHSVVEELLADGVDPEKLAMYKSLSHLLTRTIGSDARVLVDTKLEEVCPGDVLLFCTDGLWGVVDEGLLASALARDESPHEITTRLVEAALHAGGPDNVTVVVVRVEEPESAARDAREGRAPAGDQ